MKKREVLDVVFDALRGGTSLYASCVKAGLTTMEFYKFIKNDSKARVGYQLALSDYADQCMDEIRAIAQTLKAGDVDNATAKILIETSKWLAQKACPEPFDVLACDDEGTGLGGTAEIMVKFI